VGGIIGKLSFESNETLARAVLDRMLDASAHRGQQVRGVFAAPGIALGSCAADERASDVVGINDRQNVRAIADAHITNAAELRADLEHAGHRFRGHADSELIAHAYDRWGARCVERLRGPFACAIWDETERRLVLARDHMGIRPLYFALLHGHGVVFASEIRALLQDPGVPRDWCPDGIDAYLALGYVPAPLTAYRRVSKLEPAQLLIVEGRCLHVEEYWDLSVPVRRTAPRDVAWAVKGLLKSAVRGQLQDQPTAGLLYSGGIASCSLLSAAPAGAGTPITVDIDQDPSELARSDGAAAHLGRIRELEYLTQPVTALVDELAGYCGEPIADPSAMAQFAICTAAQRHSGTALTGHGAAVFWAGYARHRVERVEAIVRTWLAGPLAAMSAQIAGSLRDSIKGARALAHLRMPCADACAVKHAYGLWDDEHRRAIYTRGFAWQVRDANPFIRHLERYASRGTDDPVERALYVDARTFLPDNILALADRAALAAGIALRFPFLDRQMVELATATPTALKQRGPVGMYALRQMLAPQLPNALLPAARRRPARHPWLPGALAVMVPKMLLAPRFDGRGIVSRPALRQLWADHLDGREDHSRRLWALLMLELWFREFIDGDAAAEPLEYAVLLKAA
jgi:asparagine synthase (glutamine-hydrolysing)